MADAADYIKKWHEVILEGKMELLDKLLNDKKIKVRYLFSGEEDSLRLYRMDIKEINKDDDDNKINDVILDNDVIMVWTNLNKEIQKIRFKYNGSNFLIKLNEE
jgi:hypothetical protein